MKFKCNLNIRAFCRMLLQLLYFLHGQIIFYQIRRIELGKKEEISNDIWFAICFSDKIRCTGFLLNWLLTIQWIALFLKFRIVLY